jgi:hypothetical protein
MPKVGDLKVWWIPQVPGKPFETPVATLVEGKLLIETLARYDEFQFKHKIKPDYSNAGGLMVFDEDHEWSDWSGDYGEELDEYALDQLRADTVIRHVAMIGLLREYAQRGQDIADPSPSSLIGRTRVLLGRLECSAPSPKETPMDLDAFRARMKARLERLKSRFGDDDPDVQALAQDVAEAEGPAEKAGEPERP